MKPNALNVFLAEDDPMNREMVENFISQFPQLKLETIASNATSVKRSINSTNFDLLILDIQIQDINIFDILNQLKTLPYIIFISSHEKFAIKAFDMGAVDYLLKPFSRERFAQAIQRFFSKRSDSNNAIRNNSLFYKYKDKIYAIPTSKILYATAKGRNTLIESEDEQYLCPHSISVLADKLADNFFYRIHKSYIVNGKFIKQIIHKKSGLNDLLMNDNDDTILPVGRMYSASVKKYLSKNEEAK